MQMDQVTQQNAALVEEAAAAADSMQQQAQALQNAVAVFQVAHSSRPTSAPVGETMEPVAGAPTTERRGPNRAKNVARLRKPDSKAKPEAQPETRKTGTGDDWSEF